MVRRQSTRFARRFGCSFEVGADLSKPGAEAAQTGKLGTNTGGKRGGRAIFDITEQVLNTNFLCFFCLDC